MGDSILSDPLTLPRWAEPDRAQMRAAWAVVDRMRRDPVGAWTDDRHEQVRHFRNVIYVAVERVMALVGSATYQVLRRRRPARDGRVAKALSGPQSQGRDEAYTPYDDQDHPLVSLVARPNPVETFGELCAKLALQNRLTGVGPLWALPNADHRPVELWALKTPLLYPVAGVTARWPNGAWRVTPFWGGGWMNLGPAGVGAGGAIVPGEEVKRFMDPHPWVDFDGYSPLTAAGVQFDVLEAIDESRKSLMDRGLSLTGLMVVPGMEQANLDAFVRAFNEKHGGSRNHGGVAAIAPPSGLAEKATFTAAPGSARELGYDSGWEQMVKAVLAVFGVPPAVAGMTATGSYAELYAALKQFHEQQSHYVRRLEAWLTRVLADPWSEFPGEFLVRVKLPKIDDQEQLERQLSADTGIRTVNERRAVRDLDPVEDGDVPEQIYLKIVEQKHAPQQPPGGQPGDPGAGGGGGGEDGGGEPDPLAALLGGGGDAGGGGDVPRPDNPEGEGSLPENIAKGIGDGKQVGVPFESNGRWWVVKQVGDKRRTVPAADPNKAKPEKKEKGPTKKDQAAEAKRQKQADAAAVSAAAEKLARGGEGLTHEDVAALDAHIKLLPADAAKAAAAGIGRKIKGKAELAGVLKEWAEAKASGKEPPEAEKPKGKPAKPEKPTKEGVLKEVQALHAKEDVSPEELAALRVKLASLPQADLVAIQKELGKTGGRSKDERAGKVLERPAAGPEPVPREEPKEEPETARAYKVDESGSHVPLDDPQVIAAGQKHLADSAFRKLLADAYNRQTLFVEHQDGLVQLPRLVREMQKRDPSVTPAQVHEALAAVRAAYQVELHVLNEVGTAEDRPLSIWDDDRLYHYAFFKHGPGGRMGADPDKLAPPPGTATETPPPKTPPPKPGGAPQPPAASNPAAPEKPETPAPHPVRAALDALGVAHAHLSDDEAGERIRAAFAAPGAGTGKSPKPAGRPNTVTGGRRAAPTPEPSAGPSGGSPPRPGGESFGAVRAGGTAGDATADPSSYRAAHEDAGGRGSADEAAAVLAKPAASVGDLRAAMPPGLTEGQFARAVEHLATTGRLGVTADADPARVGRDSRLPVAGHLMTMVYTRDPARPITAADIHAAIATAKPAAKPAKGRPAGEHIDASEKAIRDAKEWGKSDAAVSLPDAEFEAEVDARLGDLAAKHSPEELREIARRTTGVVAPSGTKAVEAIREYVGKVRALIQSQNV